MIRTAAAIGSDRNADDAAHRPFAVCEVAASCHFCKELIEAGENIICKLNFNNRLQSRSAHANCAADYKCFLNGCVEYAVVAELLSERSCFTEHASQSCANILSVQK